MTQVLMRMFWGIDTEFAAAGKVGKSHVHSIQVSDGFDRNHFFTEPEQLDQWFLKQRPIPKVLYTWTTSAEFGSLKAWGYIGTDPYRDDLERVTRFRILRSPVQGTRKQEVLVLDIQPFFAQMRYEHHPMGSLKLAGEFLSDFYSEDLHKLPKPLGDEFGLRAPETKEEWEYFRKYSLRDAQICARAARWFKEELVDKYIPGVDMRKLWSWGTFAKHYFSLPRLNFRMGRRILVRPYFDMVHGESTFAGRSEAFYTGYLGDIYYNDASSLYPVTAVWTSALEIIGIKPVSPDDITKVDDLKPYGWLRGTFKTKNDLWGLPVRGLDRNYYVTGTVPHSLFHTLDLKAAKAEIIELTEAYAPTFEDNPEQDRFARLTLKKLEGDYANIPEKYAIKNTLNSLTGKLGQAEPVSMTSNFPAYNTIVAGGHYLMSVCFDQAPKPVYYMDTDSLFVDKPMEGKIMDLTSLDGEWTVPLRVDLKGTSEPPGTIIFRSKHYYQSPDSMGIHAVQIFHEDWKKIVQQLPKGIDVRRQIKRTFRTRNKKALELEIGRWEVIKERYDIDRLAQMFQADDKRVRPDYDSYTLAQEGKNAASRAWTWREWNRYQRELRGKRWLRTRTLALRKNYVTEDFVETFREKHMKN